MEHDTCLMSLFNMSCMLTINKYIITGSKKIIIQNN